MNGVERGDIVVTTGPIRNARGEDLILEGDTGVVTETLPDGYVVRWESGQSRIILLPDDPFIVAKRAHRGP